MDATIVVDASGDSSPRSVHLDRSPVTLGRSSSCDIRIPRRSISGHHASLIWQANNWYVRDEGSTNGTRLNGEPLEAGTDTRLSSGDQIRLVDVTLLFENRADDTETGLSLSQTGTLARQLLSEVLLDSPDDQMAQLDVEGPGGWRKVSLPDALSSAYIGHNDDCLVTLSEVDAPRLVELRRADDGFAVRICDTETDLSVLTNGSPLTGSRRLRDSDRLEIGPYQLTFHDPLESYLTDLDAADDQPVDGDDVLSEDSTSVELDSPVGSDANSLPEEAADQAPSTTGPARNLRLTDWLIVVVSLAAMAGAAYVLLTIFDVI